MVDRGTQRNLNDIIQNNVRLLSMTTYDTYNIWQYIRVAMSKCDAFRM